MEPYFEDDLKVSIKCWRNLSQNWFSCVVHENWLSCVRRRLPLFTTLSYDDLCPADVTLLLAPSNSKVWSPWKRVTINAIPKDDKLVQSLVQKPLCPAQPSGSLSAMLSVTDQRLWQLLHGSAKHTYNQAAQVVVQSESPPPEPQPFNCVVRQTLISLYQCHIQQLDDSKEDTTNTPDNTIHPNLSQVYGIIESSHAFYVVHPYAQFSLWDTIVFSPAKFSGDHAKKMFIVYQLVSIIEHCHSLGVSVGDVTLHDFVIDDCLWINAYQPRLERLYQRNLPDLTINQPELDLPVKSTSTYDITQEDLPTFVQAWVTHKVSNFDYLMVLNRLAGRRLGDPNHHPVLPWVMDFSSPQPNLRDLTKSKYRLNKGDRQLDLTYDTTDKEAMMDHLSIPHHVSDFLSDITYYVYKARCTPKELLCKFVRSRWVPNEYPNSIQRLQEWTPDECIPEFFNDPSIFKSIHDDLGDLELPEWASSPEDFLETHRSVLEGPEVSAALHHWIDLTFGYKLSGPAAVKSKNVCLQLVNEHTELSNHGMMQLFTHPHPHRLTYSPLLPSLHPPQTGPDQIVGQVKESGKVELMAGYDPLQALDMIEALLSFSSSSSKHLPKETTKKEESGVCIGWDLAQRDMQVLGCLLMELLLSQQLRCLGQDATFIERYTLARNVARQYLLELPRPLRRAITLLLNIDEPFTPPTADDLLHPLSSYPALTDEGHPPPSASLLLHQSCSIIPFPTYFNKLHSTLCETKALQKEIETIDATVTNVVDRILKTKRLCKRLIATWETYLHCHATDLGTTGLELVFPYLDELFDDAVMGAQAAWALFLPLARGFGKDLTHKYLLPKLIDLFAREDTTPKYLKLYHRTFIMQLIVHLRLKTFLNNFSTLLVEATAGYKNFSENEYIERQISVESEKVQSIYGNPTLSVVGPSASLEVVEDVKIALDEDDVFENDTLLDSAVFTDRRGISIGEDAMMNDVEESEAEVTEEDNPDEELMGKSLGRLSVHSMSRFLEEDRVSASSDPTTENSTDDDSSMVEIEDPDSTSTPINGRGERSKGPAISTEEAVPMCKLTPIMMVRSDTGEFGTMMDTMGSSVEFNISEVATETIKWLSHRLGPVLTAKHLSRNLLRMLALCYLGSDQQQFTTKPDDTEIEGRSLTRCPVVGDDRACQVLECLALIGTLYGEQLILIQYFTHAKELVCSAGRKLTSRSEGGLISSAKLILHMIPYLSDHTLMDLLQDTIFTDLILPLIKTVSSQHVHFPGGSQARSVLCNKILDVLYLISLRIGFEMTRQHMTFVLQKFFAAFSRVYTESTEINSEDAESQLNGFPGNGDKELNGDLYYAVKMDSTFHQFGVSDPESDRPHKLSVRQHSLQSPGSATDKRDDQSPTSPSQEDVMTELRQTFTPHLAHTAYIMFCRLAGGIHMEQSLVNDDLIRWLCSEHEAASCKEQPTDQNTDSSLPSSSEPCSPTEDESLVSGSFGRNVSVAGNKIVIQDTFSSSRRISAECSIDPNLLRSRDIKDNKQRHLRGNWLAYWEHEVGLGDNQTNFNIKQIKLQTFSGHRNSVRSIVSLDNENSFLSVSKDKTVRLWSLRNIGDGTARIGSQWTYTKHRRSVFGAVFLNSSRHVASCDGNIHIWDPFLGVTLYQLEATKSTLVTSFTSLPEPYNCLAATSCDAIVRFFDSRHGNYSHEFRCSVAPAGVIRCLTASPDGRWIAVGYSTGVISTLDLRTGVLLASWKGHDGEILQIKAFNGKQLVTSSMDQTMCLWNVDDGKLLSSFKGLTEPVHCLSICEDSVLWGSTANRVGLHASVSTLRSTKMVTKLHTEVFKGVLTTVEVLPLNRMLLLGADSGLVTLLA